MESILPSHSILFPTFGTDPSARSTAIAESKQRLWKEHIGNVASHWIYACEEDVGSGDGRIVGGCQWRFHEQNPFPSRMPEIVLYWWPEGSGRLFATEVMRQCYAPRLNWMARPHAGMSLMSVLPELQRRGVGKQLMAWGLERADQLGLESFIETSEAGRKLYEGCGYTTIRQIEVRLEESTADKDDEWMEL